MNNVLLKPGFCAANGIIATGTEGKIMFFGLTDINDTVLKYRVKKAYPGYQCIFSVVDQETFNIKLSQMYSETEKTETDLGGVSTDAALITGIENKIDRIADDAPAVNLLNSIFLEALSRRASDIHIESGPNESSIRYRVDGLLQSARVLSKERAASVSARLKVLANLNILENRRPQDGHIDIKTNDYSLDVRISIVPTIWGESIVLRLLNRSDVPLNLDSLGFSAAHQTSLRSLLLVSSGLILVTGPTGSGKTTTLAAILKELKDRNCKIISIEDPVEYRIDDITQIQVNEELDLTFESILRRIFRQDPDIIMIGEIRDTKTAELAARAALTGHLVFATLHTNNAAEAIYRLRDLGIPDYTIAPVLKMIITQRLIRKICPDCNNAGCPRCLNTGWFGRTVIAEIINTDETLRAIIAGGIKTELLQAHLLKINHKTLWDDAREKAGSGISTVQEIKRELGGQP
ncbi:MAG: GspE/PulE family protein [Treponema sp.]|nr:GspE/PulE family protein [Treponema sp.]